MADVLNGSPFIQTDLPTSAGAFLPGEGSDGLLYGLGNAVEGVLTSLGRQFPALFGAAPAPAPTAPRTFLSGMGAWPLSTWLLIGAGVYLLMGTGTPRRARRNPRVPRALAAWRSRQRHGAIMSAATFRRIERQAQRGGARSPQAVAGAAYWRTARAKFHTRGNPAMVKFRRVKYHSDLWEALVEAGWITVSVVNGMARMLWDGSRGPWSGSR